MKRIPDKPFHHRASAPAMIFVFALVALWLPARVLAQMSPGLHKHVVFSEYSPLARSEELIDRLFRPLLAERLRSELKTAGAEVSAQNVDLTREHFSLYLPATAVPAKGYGLLVFIAPQNEPEIPSTWFPVLDRHGVICVAAAGSGNSENVFSRRIPLALLGYENIKRTYSIDAERIYIGGFSGGSRVAQRVALAFPDIFHGALLNAGSDLYGSAPLPPPTRQLEDQFEEQSRVVYATGAHDTDNLATDGHSRESARDLCIADLQTASMAGRGHALIDAATLERALTLLDAARSADPDRAACRARRTQEIIRQLAAINTLTQTGNRGEASKQLQVLDEHFGGLAAPRSIQLAHQQ